MSEQSESALDKLLDSEKWDDDSYGACCRCPVSMLDLEAARGELERLRKKAELCDTTADKLRDLKRKYNAGGRGLKMLDGRWLARYEAIEEGVARG